MRQLWNLNPHIPNDLQGKQSVGVLYPGEWRPLPGGGYPGTSVRIDVVSGNAQIWFSRVTCTGLNSWSGCSSQIQIRDQNSVPITPENGDESLLKTPFCIFYLPFKVIFNVCIIKLARKSMSHWKLLYKLWFNLCLGSLPITWERPRSISAMADVIPHHNKGPAHHLHHNWRVSQGFPFHELWIWAVMPPTFCICNDIYDSAQRPSRPEKGQLRRNWEHSPGALPLTANF